MMLWPHFCKEPNDDHAKPAMMLDASKEKDWVTGEVLLERKDFVRIIYPCGHRSPLAYLPAALAALESGGHGSFCLDCRSGIWWVELRPTLHDKTYYVKQEVGNAKDSRKSAHRSDAQESRTGVGHPRSKQDDCG